MTACHKAAALAALLLLASCAIHARSAAQVYRFKQMEPCPATRQSRGPCPGWQVDHITPLCAGGDDKAWNMQWLSVDDHRFKTFVDVGECRRKRFGTSIRPKQIGLSDTSWIRNNNPSEMNASELLTASCNQRSVTLRHCSASIA